MHGGYSSRYYSHPQGSTCFSSSISLQQIHATTATVKTTTTRATNSRNKVDSLDSLLSGEVPVGPVKVERLEAPGQPGLILEAALRRPEFGGKK